MGNLSEFLMEELNVATAFTIPIFGGIEVAESTVISWVIMAIIVILTLVLTRNMRVEKARQAAGRCGIRRHRPAESRPRDHRP